MIADCKTMAVVAACACLCGAASWGGAQRVAESLDAAGGRETSANYTLDGCLGGIGGVSSNAAPQQTARHGFPGQLTEVAALSVTGTPSLVNEGASSQFGGLATMDDATVTVLPGVEIAWAAPAYPIAGITTGGLATAGAVFADTNGAFNGSYLGTAGAGALAVLDSDPDNFGSYAGDGLPDDWQYQYFGLSNPNAAPGADPDHDTQDNDFEWIANLVPTNAASRFVLRIAPVPGQPTRKNLIFSPRFDSRTYIPQHGSDLKPGGYQTLTTLLTSDGGPERTVTDTNATARAKFYRVEITNP